MKDIYLTNYSVKGIKTLDKTVSLSFYKKTINKEPDTQEYNIKGIYGMNGSGKSGIVTSVEILRNLIIDTGYLNNPVAQKHLDAIVNKKVGELSIEAEFIAKSGAQLLLFQYGITLSKNKAGKFTITHECLKEKNATSKNSSLEIIYEICDGEIIFMYGLEEENGFVAEIRNKTMNLLTTGSACALIYVNMLCSGDGNYSFYREDKVARIIMNAISVLFSFGHKLHVYLDESDDHKPYMIQNTILSCDDVDSQNAKLYSLIGNIFELQNENINVIFSNRNMIAKTRLDKFIETINKLYEFLHIFKSDLMGIEIDKKENGDFWMCDLVMVYDSYKIHAEFESTGIKKLIKLFVYVREMVRGGIVFIDEFDSNLHDVYLCALLEYLMEYGEGQLCFTTHNVGPMDVLKQHKKSIDFLSEDHQIYPWKTNGNYSPSKLYRNGMIEGSPFNVDAIDFIGVFGTGEEDTKRHETQNTKINGII